MARPPSSVLILPAVLVLILCLAAEDARAARAGRPAREAPPAPAPIPLAVENRTGAELVGIRVSRGDGHESIGLALGPDADDTLENPGGAGALRLDLGLALWFFDDVPLAGTRRMTATAADGVPALILTGGDGARRVIRGREQSLLPAAGDRPVCELTRFRPGMRMDEACALLESDPRRDDNDTVLTTLGYAGVVWAARLAAGPASSEADISDAASRALAGVELRQRLTPARLSAVLRLLAKQDYAPWQAEFPGVDLNFTEMASFSRGQKDALLQQLLDQFMRAEGGEAGVTLAPAHMLPALAGADDPPEGAQIFTLTLNRTTGVLLVNMASCGSQP